MATLTQTNRQWMSRPADERFTDLADLASHAALSRARSRAGVVSSRAMKAIPDPQDELKGLVVVSSAGVPYAPTHWGFGQLAARAGAPAGYMRQLPAPMAADCINYGLMTRQAEDVGLLLYSNGTRELRAATGPNYGRVWNVEVADLLVDKFGNGVDGQWRVPGEFGKAVTVTKDNTTLYCGDRDMFVFLCDERNRVTVDGRRNGEPGSLARGFFVWNSEVGGGTLGMARFYFDYVCCNRLVWGAKAFERFRIRHTAAAPDRFIEEMVPMLQAYANDSARPVEDAIKIAQAKKIDDVKTFLERRFTAKMANAIRAAHMAEEDRPIETLWDAATGITAFAKRIPYQGERVKMEAEAGKILDLVAA